jgi:acetyltransferase-like isoleucine patch superfamily enzyme
MELLSLVAKNLRVLYWTWYLSAKGVRVGKNLIVKGRPRIMRFSGSIRIGDNVTLRSCDYGYHSSLYGPTRLMTDTSENALIEIGDNTRINGASIHATERISIGRNCLVAANVTILDSDGHGLLPGERTLVNPAPKPVIIEDNVWIGINAIILKGVRIGQNSVIGAGSVVTRDVPPNCVVAGNPAQVIRTLDRS